MTRRQALAITGLGALVASFGVGLAWPPGGVIVAGATLALLGLLADYKR